jgi:hypothetical protein
MFSGTRLARSLTRRDGIKLAVSAFLGCRASSAAATPQIIETAWNIPPRSPRAPSGSEFARLAANLGWRERERAILDQLLDGNVPGFLRQFVPVKLGCDLARGIVAATTIFVMPEYLAVGSDVDFLRIPMDLYTASAVANRFGCVLPTKKIVDAIYDQATCRYTPQPLPPGPQMTSTGYYRLHNGMIQQQSQIRGFRTGALASGHKKDIVLTNRLNRAPGRIAIYGWHRGNGQPIQPLSTVHGAEYADYSHGIRLMSRMVLVDGRFRDVHEVLEDSTLAPILSDEGPIRVPSHIGRA